MAETPSPKLKFSLGCPDCGLRQVDLPGALPDAGDDFDWRVRDYDGFRLFMLEELIARFPERRRWTPADMEVVIVEVLSAVLDQLSDMLDRTSAEAFLETARRPESVRRLLSLIGYDALRKSEIEFDPEDPDSRNAALQQLEMLWLREPHKMDEARKAGPRAIRTQRRMVTEKDHAIRLEEHPLVQRAHSWSEWSGSWQTIHVALVAKGNTPLDEPLPDQIGQEDSEALQAQVEDFHDEHGLDLPDWEADPALRSILRPYLDAYRMAGQEVFLRDAEPVGIVLSLSVRVASNYFQSEVRRAVEEALGTGVGGFFEPGRLRFGEDLHAGDIFQTIAALDGVETVCLNRFKRVGKRFPDQSDSGRIVLQGLEIGVCDNKRNLPHRGYYYLKLHGGRKG